MKRILISTLGLGWSLLIGVTSVFAEGDAARISEMARVPLEDRNALRELIRSMLVWSSSQQDFEPLPAVPDDTGTRFVGLDANRHRQNVYRLRQTGIFAEQFIANYDRLITNLDQMLRRGDFGEWFVGDLPPFDFASDHDPWCQCQDHLDPSALEIIELSIEGSVAAATWTWGQQGGASRDQDPGFKRSIRAVREDRVWRISYLSGFDFDLATKGPDDGD